MRLARLSPLLALAALAAAGLDAATRPAPTEPPAPPEAAEPAERRDLCRHFRGEEPYDEERRRFLEKQIDKYCSLAERLIELTGFVLGPGFNAAATAERFGPETPTHLQHAIRFAPRDPLYRTVEIQTYGDSEPVVLILRFARPVLVDLAPLIADFGEPEERPRVHFDDPIPWRFDLQGGGWLVLESGASEIDARHEITTVRIHRRPGG